ncbi:MAG TPA: hypothetical protein VM684_06900 [Gaiellales bacterium]|jgi:hypothetical protein|nr:hypothetical protein [Gaiellales bacterium]HVI35938.1 hypothetical protein [Gaiellales bacterium]
MARKPYEPPQQGRIGQLFDTAFLLVLVFAALFAPLVLGLGGGGTTTVNVAEKTWAALGQNQAMQQQWDKLGYTAEKAADIITTRFDYSVSPIALIATAIIIVGYFVFVVRYSDKEYREVIAERFGDGRR